MARHEEFSMALANLLAEMSLPDGLYSGATIFEIAQGKLTIMDFGVAPADEPPAHEEEEKKLIVESA